MEFAQQRLGKGEDSIPFTASCVEWMKLAVIFVQLDTDNRQLLLKCGERNALLYVECLQKRVRDL